jgi:hypothetical protein
MIKILLKCESPEEAAMYLEAPRIRGGGRFLLTGSGMQDETRRATQKKNTPCREWLARNSMTENLGEML